MQITVRPKQTFLELCFFISGSLKLLSELVNTLSCSQMTIYPPPEVNVEAAVPDVGAGVAVAPAPNTKLSIAR